MKVLYSELKYLSVVFPGAGHFYFTTFLLCPRVFYKLGAVIPLLVYLLMLSVGSGNFTFKTIWVWTFIQQVSLWFCFIKKKWNFESKRMKVLTNPWFMWSCTKVSYTLSEFNWKGKGVFLLQLDVQYHSLLYIQGQIGQRKPVLYVVVFQLSSYGTSR